MPVARSLAEGHKVEGCDIRHHILVREVELNIIERARARKVEKRTEGETSQESTITEAGKKPANQTEKLLLGGHRHLEQDVLAGTEMSGKNRPDQSSEDTLQRLYI